MVLSIQFQPTGLMPVNADPVLMEGSSLTIGRGGSNNIKLVDNERMISTNHCVIEDQGGEFVILDTSSNGTFLNYGKIPIGDNPTILNDGDILSIGPYELLMDLSDKEDDNAPGFQNNFTPPIPLESSDEPELDEIINVFDEPEPSGDFLTDLVGEGPKNHDSLEKSDLDDDIDIFSNLNSNNDDPLSNNLIPDDVEFELSVSDHSPSVQDSFTPSNHSVIPDDWDDETLAVPTSSVGDPFQNNDLSPTSDSGLDPFHDEEDALTEIENNKNEIKHENLNVQKDVKEVSAFNLDNNSLKADSDNIQKLVKETDKNPAISNPLNSPLDDDPLSFSMDDDPLSLGTEETWKQEVNISEPVEAVRENEKATLSSLNDFDDPKIVKSDVKASINDAAIKAFIKALDIDDLKISEDQIIDTMSQMGNVCRVLITGIREVLMTRTSIKSEFKMNQTMIGARGNNPLKFSVSAEEAVRSIVLPASRGYLSSDKAAEEALRDVKAHEIAMVSGMEAALKSVLDRLSPKKLEAMMDDDGKMGSLLKGKKARYWEVYEKMYSQISEQAENEFHEFFSKEFSKAYEEQLEKLK